MSELNQTPGSTEPIPGLPEDYRDMYVELVDHMIMNGENPRTVRGAAKLANFLNRTHPQFGWGLVEGEAATQFAVTEGYSEGVYEVESMDLGEFQFQGRIMSFWPYEKDDGMEVGLVASSLHSPGQLSMLSRRVNIVDRTCVVPLHTEHTIVYAKGFSLQN